MREAGLREAFERLSAEYDARFPKIIPRYAEFHAVIVGRLVAHLGSGPAQVVELGCGTGELSRRLLEALPHLRLQCIDLSPAMIERAREKLAPWSDRTSFIVGNFLTTPVPEGSGGAVSALAVHHLDPEEKRMLFSRLGRQLGPRGLFVLGDAVAGESDFTTAYYEERWVEHMRASGMEEREILSVLEDHRQNDRFSTLGEQMRWLAEGGFTRVECLWKHFLLAVVAAEKA